MSNQRSLIGSLLILGSFALGPAAASNAVGIWQGTLQISTVKLRIVFHITTKPDSTLSATMDSPDQGASDIAVDTVTRGEGSLRLVSNAVHGSFEGRLSADAETLSGTWKQGGMSLPLVMSKIEKVETPNRPQEPKPPYPYNADDVTFVDKPAGDTLAGTLTYPKTKGPFPAVVLITGSGPENRNEEVFGQKPFLVLADYLTRDGIAVLRFDDRGVGKSTGKFTTATSVDFKQDVEAALDFLKTRKEIDKKHVGLIGHSEGGMIAPMVADKRSDVKFIVLMAGTGLPGEQVLDLQIAALMKAESIPDSSVAKTLVAQKQVYEIVKSSPDTAKTAPELRRVIREAVAKMSEKERQGQDTSEAVIAMQVKQVTSPWFRFFLTYDPRPVLQKVKVPVLAINGEKDLQVLPKDNLAAIEQALKAGGNKDYSVKELPGLNHLFQTANTGAPDEYATIEETIAPEALKTMGDWILAHSHK